MNVTALSNDEVVSNVRSFNAEGNRVLAKLLVNIGEMDARELYKLHACSSMFAYCRKLGMSEGSAARRIDSARAVRRFPSFLPLIESGKLHLTALSIVRGILTPENVESVIASVIGKTTREVEEVKEDGYKVQFQGDKAMVDPIERIKAMMRHRNPKGDLMTMFCEALDLLEAKLEKERFAATSRPQEVRKPCAPGHIAAATRREVFERDGRQCTFVDPEGDRCPERGFLELDHIDPAAFHGSDEAPNLRVRCRAHNQMHAKDVFGADFIERRIEESRRDRAKRAPTHSGNGSESDRSP